jgi:hypothetical protein
MNANMFLNLENNLVPRTGTPNAIIDRQALIRAWRTYFDKYVLQARLLKE